jgi:hypothetical protein
MSDEFLFNNNLITLYLFKVPFVFLAGLVTFGVFWVLTKGILR